MDEFPSCKRYLPSCTGIAKKAILVKISTSEEQYNVLTALLVTTSYTSAGEALAVRKEVDRNHRARTMLKYLFW